MLVCQKKKMCKICFINYFTLVVQESYIKAMFYVLAIYAKLFATLWLRTAVLNYINVLASPLLKKWLNHLNLFSCISSIIGATAILFPTYSFFIISSLVAQVQLIDLNISSLRHSFSSPFSWLLPNTSTQTSLPALSLFIIFIYTYYHRHVAYSGVNSRFCAISVR